MAIVSNLTRQTYPRLPYKKIKESVLGIQYNLSVVFIGTNKSFLLNKKYRKKSKETNILSFPLNRNTGEIFLNTSLIKKEAKEFGALISDYTAYLFIHGLLHLKGLRHGSKMESEEKTNLKRFGYKIFSR